MSSLTHFITPKKSKRKGEWGCLSAPRAKQGISPLIFSNDSADILGYISVGGIAVLKLDSHPDHNK